MSQIALFTQTHAQPHITCMRTARCKFIGQVDLKWLVMRPTAPANFDGDATTDRLDPTGRLRSTGDSSRLNSYHHHHHHHLL